MIRRRDQHGIVLIPQSQVGRVAAQLAGMLGGEIEPPEHVAAMARAAEWSRRGWEELDDFPVLDARRLPCEQEDLPPLEQVAAWERSSAYAWSCAEEDADSMRAAAMVSILALQWSAKPSLHRQQTRRENFEFNRLLHLEAERLERVHEVLGLRREIATNRGLPEAGAELGSLTRPERELVREVRLLELLLELAREACGHTVVERALGVCARRWDASEELVMARWTPGGQRLQVKPWCLSQPRVELSIEARGITARRYRDAADLQQAIVRAAELTLHVDLEA